MGEQEIVDDSKSLAEKIYKLGRAMVKTDEELRLFYIEHGPKDRLQEFRKLQALLKQKEEDQDERVESGEEYTYIDANLVVEVDEINRKLKLF